MKPPNINAPMCSLFSIQCFIIQIKRSQGLNGLATAHCEYRWGQLTSESHFESVRAAEAKKAATLNHLMSKRQSVLYFQYSTLFSKVKCHKGSLVLPRLLPSIVIRSLLRRAHFESLRAAEAKNAATINQLKYRSRSCITPNIALGAWSRANKALGCASCFIVSRPHPCAIFAVMHSHGTLTSIYVHVEDIPRIQGCHKNLEGLLRRIFLPSLLPLSNVHAHTRTQTHTRTHIHVHSLSLSLWPSLSLSFSVTLVTVAL